jgi:FkbM family methyltransferase
VVAIDSPLASETPLPHKARSFTDPPSRRLAPQLLAELASTSCAYAPVSADAPLALYGAGNLGGLARDFLKFVGCGFVMAIDRNARRIATEADWCGVRLLQPDDVTDDDKRRLCLAVCVATVPYVPLERSLTEFGFANVVPFYDLAESFRPLHPLSNGWFAAPFSSSDQESTAGVLSLWDDDISRAHHLQFLAWRSLREEWTFEHAQPLPNDTRFFIPEVASVLHDHEILLDAGAHYGSVTKAFVEQTTGAFLRIVAIEPDPTNRAHLEETLRALLPDDRRITVYECALAEAEGEAPFHSGLGYASQLVDTGQMRIMVRPLDTLDISPTFVKLHLEGGELAALKGARQTLIDNRPLLAATVYHNDDGIWRTARWLMDTLADYRILFRLHSWCGTGAVIYAIPNERIER